MRRVLYDHEVETKMISRTQRIKKQAEKIKFLTKTRTAQTGADRLFSVTPFIIVKSTKIGQKIDEIP
jgi:hypothetical protein